jgi:hypothetical protein
MVQVFWTPQLDLPTVMTQTSMLQYQRIDTSFADAPDDDAESKSIKNIAQPHHETPICTLQDTPQCRTTDGLHGSGSDGHGGRDVEHHASTGLILNLASHRSIRDNSSPHYPPPPQPLHAPVHLLLSSTHAAAATLEDGDESCALPPPVAQERAADAERSGQVCFVCMDAAADAVLIECGHGGLCAGQTQCSPPPSPPRAARAAPPSHCS